MTEIYQSHKVSQSFSIKIPEGPYNLYLAVKTTSINNFCYTAKLCAKKQDVWHLQLLHPSTVNCLMLLCSHRA